MFDKFYAARQRRSPLVLATSQGARANSLTFPWYWVGARSLLAMGTGE
ncbi:hypothetical protein [Cylindrospermopsis raciborskii]|uniref:Uncharacterized protein n=1 Tax=Cylindrospermopsis raciborskii CS-506_A TaxID=2585140 RepID=A0A838WLS9_9CYAN|nr:hypothetical protein [Cylindrospermopsis raciborskii]MBA4444921.1 hypothetical protein [Cylindrospermopsis raciborskii CS-506_C]MBA4449139.1 hypothetical protein [Cylindrospermopsis raciborskii CS-506_D]MBA4455772.1 hypothetical protein [Cylindrospermopsis raciborskii CS-506_B]MBA4465120.1 hypothetical protein [Cylindrospermopsis raciborskii CS-506_A]